MATPFTKIANKPLFKSVKEEIESRRTINQLEFDGSNTEYFQPYFIIKRKPKKLINEWDKSESYEPVQKKFSKLGVLSEEGIYEYDQGLDYIEDKGGEFRADPHITDVTIEVQDMTFYTFTMNFKVPDIHDFSEFKDMWLDWGAPVEIEFGKNLNIEDTYQEGDGNPHKQKQDGFIANFNVQEGGGNRSMTGSITIYSSTWLQLLDNAHPKQDMQNMMRNYILDGCHNIFLYRNNELYHQKIDEIKRRAIDYTEAESFQDDKTNLFYAVMDAEEYLKQITSNWENIDKINEIQETQKKRINERIDKLQGRIDYIESRPNPSERQIKNLKYSIEIAEGYLQGKGVPSGFSSWRQQTEFFGGQLFNLFSDTSHLNLYTIPYGMDLIESTELVKTIRDVQVRERQSTGLGIDPTMPGAGDVTNYNISTRKFEDFEKQHIQLQKIIGKQDLYKYALANLNLKTDDRESLPWYYISVRALEYYINEFQKEYHSGLDELQQEEVLLSNFDLTNVQIRNLESVGMGSKHPDKMVINPWKKKYELNDQGEYVLSENGTITLLGDVFFSVDYIDQMLAEVKSPLGFVNKMIDTIKASSGKMIDLDKLAQLNYNEETSQVFTDTITLYDPIMIRDDLNDSQSYTTFNLYNPLDKIKNVTVQSNITEDMAQYAYHRSRGITRTPNEKLLFKRDDNESVKPLYNYFKELNEEFTGIGDKPFLTGKEADIPFTLDTRKERNRIGYEAKKMVESKVQLFEGSLQEAMRRTSDYLDSDGDIKATRYYTASILAYIKIYFNLIMKATEARGGTGESIEIPMTINFDLDGISSIFVGQLFKVDQESFPMRLPYETQKMVCIVTSVSQQFSGSKWTTTIGATPFIPFSEKLRYEQEVMESVYLKNLTMALEMVTLDRLHELIGNS